jgi:hypothetical protein
LVYDAIRSGAGILSAGCEVNDEDEHFEAPTLHGMGRSALSGRNRARTAVPSLSGNVPLSSLQVATTVSSRNRTRLGLSWAFAVMALRAKSLAPQAGFAKPGSPNAS